MSEQRFLARLREGVKSYLNPLHGTDDCLLFMIDENVKPRDTGTLIVACGGKVLYEVPNLELYGSNPEPVLKRLQANATKLQACSAQRVEFKNVSEWLQGEICRGLAGLGIPDSGRLNG